VQRREFMILAGGTAMLPLAALAQHGWPEFPRRGGLTGYGPDLAEQYLLSGVYMCGRILKGGKPQDLPVAQPTKFKVVLNLKTMRALDIEVPANIPRARRRGDRVNRHCGTFRHIQSR
jgi:ABC transporter substrate binding protein